MRSLFWRASVLTCICLLWETADLMEIAAEDSFRIRSYRNGATAIEYGLIATGIAVAIIPVITGVGTRLKTTFTSIQTALR